MPKTIYKCPFENCGKDCINTYCFRHQKIMGTEFPKLKIMNEIYYLTEQDIEGTAGNEDGNSLIICMGKTDRYFGKSFNIETKFEDKTYIYNKNNSIFTIYLDFDTNNFQDINISLSLSKEDNMSFPLKYSKEKVKESKYFKGAGREIITIEPQLR